MYAKRIQLVNYGPIDHLDITFPFEGDTPKPVLLVGENGSGKSILLSHIVNGLVSAKDIIYPETPEVEAGKVYKIRASPYIKSGGEYYFGKVDFEDGLFVTEMRSRRLKQEYDATPLELLGSDAQGAWDKMKPEESDYFDSSFSLDENKVKNTITKNCVLYFPPNRFEEPAWLNEENLKAQAQYMGLKLKHIQGYTARKVIDYSPLHDNQNWLFDLIYDRATFELQTRSVNIPINNTDTRIPLPISESRPEWEQLEDWVRSQVQRLIQELLEEEVTAFLGRAKSALRSDSDSDTGYRNGYGRARRLTLSSGTIQLRRPRVRDTEEQFESRLLPLFVNRPGRLLS